MNSVNILVLTEDTGKQAQPTIQSLIRVALKDLSGSIDTRRLKFVPSPSDENARKSARLSGWKDRHPSPEKIRLLERVATHLVQGGYVFIHIDSDTTWTDRKKSENRSKFEAEVRNKVASRLSTSFGRMRTFIPLSNGEALAHARRIFTMFPCYSIESWLYQATEVLRKRCVDFHASVSHSKLIDSWEKNRQMLDEVYKIKDTALSECVADKFNQELSQYFPSGAVGLAERSWREFASQLAACEELIQSLAD